MGYLLYALLGLSFSMSLGLNVSVACRGVLIVSSAK